MASRTPTDPPDGATAPTDPPTATHAPTDPPTTTPAATPAGAQAGALAKKKEKPVRLAYFDHFSEMATCVAFLG